MTYEGRQESAIRCGIEAWRTRSTDNRTLTALQASIAGYSHVMGVPESGDTINKAIDHLHTTRGYLFAPETAQ